MAYQPAGNLTTTSTISHAQQVLYKKRGLDRLQKKFVFRGVCMDDMLPKQSGKTVQWFRYTNLSANTTPTTEGTVGTSLSLTSRIIQASISQYTSFITLSDLAIDTLIDPVVQSASELLGYQAGLSVDTITRNIIDAESTGTDVSLLGTYAKVADLRNLHAILQASDVQPFEDGEFMVIIHPYVSYDIINDPSANGLADVYKYTNPQAAALVKREDRGVVTHVAGAKVIESTNVKVTAGSPNKYRMYYFGYGGIGCVDLEGRGPQAIKDPSKQRFRIRVVKGGPENLSIADPEGVIGAAVSYNFVFTAVVLDGPASIGGTYRYRTVDAASSIG